jgi:hypothetical protein
MICADIIANGGKILVHLSLHLLLGLLHLLMELLLCLAARQVDMCSKDLS